MGAPTEAFIFWQHDVSQTVPNNTWTPLILGSNRASRPNRKSWTDNKFVAASTTVAAGSNGAVLPQGTINVADTTGGGNPKLAFATSGYLAMRIGGTDRVVRYTGKTATSFTGATLGVGTMTTGDQVRQACVEFKPPFPALVVATAEVKWANDATATGVRGIRFNANQFGLVAGTTVIGAAVAANPVLHVQTTEQPAFALGSPTNFVEVFQSSGGNLDSVFDNQLDAPRLVVVTSTPYTIESAV